MPKSPPIARRIPWVSITLSLLLLVATFLGQEPIRDAVDGGVIGDARLDRSLGYVMLGPISSMLDAMTLFTVGQIIAFTVWAIGLYMVFRLRHRSKTSVGREALLFGAAFVGLIIVYAAAAVLPRPMARLIVTRSDVLAVDFHSHTKYSHDGRYGWSAADLRDWHTAAGFNVAYITDHATFDGATEGMALDSIMAGQTTTLLPGLEAFYHGEHINILNAGYRYKGLTTADYRDVDDQALALATIPGAEPIFVETIPGNLSKLIAAHGKGTAGVRAIEIVDGSPRGMSQTHSQHDRIVQLADSLDLALVSGSDNHGWGRTAPGWTLVRLADWRGFQPSFIATQIEEAIRLSGRRATKVVERTTASSSSLGVALTLPTVLWTVMRTLSGGERLSWVVWIWGLWTIAWLIRRRRAMSAA